MEYKIITNELIAKDVYKMILKGDTSMIKAPGQFLNIAVDGFYLRRPISISDYSEDTVTIIYKTFGEGTKALSKYQSGRILDILNGLGNGFEVKKENTSLLVAGGVGVPPMYNLAKELIKKGNKVIASFGFAGQEDVLLKEELEELGVTVHISSSNGSIGTKGNPIEFITKNNIEFDSYYACGPNGMLNALLKMDKEGQLSYEERMGCGFGACMGCSKKTTTSYKRVCKEGPVFNSGEVKF